MVFKRMTVVVVAIALVCVAIGGGYLLLSGSPPVTPPVPPGVAPKVTSTSPLNAATGTPLNGKVIVTFSKAMNPATITTTTFTLKHGTALVAGTVTYAGTTATFSPASNLGAVTAHSATITTGAKDTSGVALAATYTWNFTTGQVPDTSPPLVSFVSPAPSATGTPLNTKVLATFSKAMDPSTISTTTFALKHGSTSTPGAVTYAGVTATFVPSSNLVAGTVYTAAITTGATDSMGHPLGANFAWSFTTGQVIDTTPPRVSFTSPASAATGTPVNTQILATFSKAMDPATLTTTTFILTQGASSVSGAVSYAGQTATFVPSNNLAPSTAYTATITGGAKDLAGNALQANFVWSFATGQAPDTTLPRVTSTSPVADATDVAVNRDISVTFSEAMDPSTVTVASFGLSQGTTPVSGLVTYAGLTAVFNPGSDFAPDTAYTVMVTTGARDLAGNALQANFGWGFRTGQAPDTTAPTVTSTSPAAGSVTALSSNILGTFSEAMDAATITVSSFVVAQGTSPVSGLVSYAGLTATFDPASDLAADATYTATLTTEARDLAGNALQGNYVWSFTTGSSACGQLPVNLGSASGFAVVAGSTVTNTGGTIVTGDVGLSPGSDVVGFPPGSIVGTLHVSDTAAAGAISDLTIAYNDAAGRTLCPVSVSGNLGGMTLAPGLYKSTSGLEITSGDLTLDAQGNPNAVFIFQMASTLATSPGLKVILAGGAQAKNIFWQVGTSATLEVNSTMVGTIMADQSISLATGAILEGRALARIGAVTLDANTVTKPSA